MTTYRLGVLAFAVLGVDFLLSAIIRLISMVGWVGSEWTWHGFGLVLDLLAAVAGLALLRWRTWLSTLLFGADGLEVGAVSLWDLQVAGLATLGVWLLATSLRELVLRFTWTPDARVGALSIGYQEYPVGDLLRDGFKIGAGLCLILKGRIIARLWCTAPAQESPAP